MRKNDNVHAEFRRFCRPSNIALQKTLFSSQQNRVTWRKIKVLPDGPGGEKKCENALHWRDNISVSGE